MKLLHSTRGFGLVTNHYSGSELVLLSRKVFSWYGGRGGGGGREGRNMNGPKGVKLLIDQKWIKSGYLPAYWQLFPSVLHQLLLVFQPTVGFALLLFVWDHRLVLWRQWASIHQPWNRKLSSLLISVESETLHAVMASISQTVKDSNSHNRKWNFKVRIVATGFSCCQIRCARLH